MSEVKESKSETPSECEIREFAEMEAACSNLSLSSQNQQKSVFTVASKSRFNLEAPPFEMPIKHFQNHPKIKIGPSSVEVNGNIWNAIASTRPLPVLNHMPQLTISSPPVIRDYPPTPSMFSLYRANPCEFNGFNNPPLFEDDYSRNLLFTRNYGPVANLDGFVEFRLHENITICISVNRSILIRNPKAKVTIAVSHDLMSSAIEHPNGKVYQANGSIDMICFDGSKKLNNYIRYAKMWEKGISLTAEGCALIYLVDNAGSRTTSDAVNKDISTDYCLKVFFESSTLGPHLLQEAEIACNSYHFSTQKDGSHVFDILGYRISQTTDGMVQVSRPNNRLKIHTSPSNGSARLSTQFIHSTASMGRSSHLFVRFEERRMHFDGTSIVVRNQGHSAGFDEDNNLRIY